jgi:peptidoglycan-N-acetylglucosamine deacetylase
MLVALLAAFVTAAVLVQSSGSKAKARRDPAPFAAVKGRSERQPARHDSRVRSHAGSRVAAVDAALRYTPFIARGTARQRAIALTFDDGPSPYTESIVSILVRMHVPATFFVVGQQLDYFSDGLRDEVRHGFVIGDHTENHAWLIRLGAAGQYAQIDTDAMRLERLGAPFPELFRPPYGAYDARTLTALRRLRMLMVMWSIDPGDWRRPGTRAIVDNVIENAKPGAIVIMHDGGGDRSQTVAALPAIVNGLRRRHYRLVTVPQLLTLDPPPHHEPLPHLSGV